METHHILLLGCLGALAPELVRLYSIKHRPEEFRWSTFYVVVSILFAALGGVVAMVLPATTYWGALYAGISTPTLLNVAATRALRGRPSRKKGPVGPTKSHLESFIGGL